MFIIDWINKNLEKNLNRLMILFEKKQLPCVGTLTDL